MFVAVYGHIKKSITLRSLMLKRKKLKALLNYFRSHLSVNGVRVLVRVYGFISGGGQLGGCWMGGSGPVHDTASVRFS